MDENRNTNTDANMEPDAGDGLLAKEKAKGSNPPYCITVHSVRKRLADIDGISAKAAIDGIVKAGLLPDDSARYVKKVSFTQEKGKEEKTIITIQGLSL